MIASPSPASPHRPAPRPADLWRRGLTCISLMLLTAAAPKSSEAPFLAENASAMDRMMAAMTVKPTGAVDQDFVSMMEPHHRGAVEMAEAELRHGHNTLLRRIAQEIIVEQQQEIVAMRLAVGRPLPSPAPAPDQQKPTSKAGMAMGRP